LGARVARKSIGCQRAAKRARLLDLKTALVPANWTRESELARRIKEKPQLLAWTIAITGRPQPGPFPDAQSRSGFRAAQIFSNAETDLHAFELILPSWRNALDGNDCSAEDDARRLRQRKDSISR
jgi:hypothetical protein